MRDIPTKDDHLPRYGMNLTYFEAIRRCGGIPVPLAPGPPEEMEVFLARGSATGFALDGLCLTGGGDPDPSLFGQERRPHCGEPDLERDRTELHLLSLVRETDLPILAVCRGIQVLNVACGGTLIQDIASERPEAQKHDFWNGYPRDKLAHDIRIASGSLLYRIVGSDSLRVNSLHHQALDRIGEGLVATAWAPDGIIEAAELAREESGEASGNATAPGSAGSRFLLGVQFHPEDLQALEPMRKLFQALVDAARGFRRERGCLGP
jgi:putative glutamine amidotransferase